MLFGPPKTFHLLFISSAENLYSYDSKIAYKSKTLSISIYIFYNSIGIYSISSLTAEISSISLGVIFNLADISYTYEYNVFISALALFATTSFKSFSISLYFDTRIV